VFLQNDIAAVFFLTYDSNMQQLLMTICLTTSLLVCPARCAACHAECAAKAQEQQEQTEKPRCRCCTEKRKDKNESSKHPSGQDSRDNECGCPNCICEGATRTDAPEVSSPVATSLIEPWTLPIDDVCGVCIAAEVIDHRIRLSLSDGLRTCLALRQSWLL